MPFPEDRLLRGGLLIDGQWHWESSAGTMEHVNPATGKAQADFPIAGPAEIDEAIEAARRALPSWRAVPAAQRQAMLHQIAASIREHTDVLARVTVQENGSPRLLAAGLLPMAADAFDYYAGWVDKLNGDVLPTEGSFSYTRPEPVGVVAIVLTWNTPTAAFALKVATALAAGCTVVVKAPELAPFSSALLGELVQAVGVPSGVLNIVTGGPEAGDALVRHPGVDKVSFTGSPETAAKIQAACAASITPLVLELGGKSASIVLSDADLDAAAFSAAIGIAALSGQVCVAPTRLLVEQPVHDEMVEKVLLMLSGMSPGDPNDPTVIAGPLISAKSRDRILSIVEQTQASGHGTLQVGGESLGGDLADGFYVSPAVFTDVDNQSPLAQEEAFGPILSVISVGDIDEAITVANDSRYGLAAYVHTRDISTAMHVASRLDVGNVAVNGAQLASQLIPFGGVKASGYGREGGLQGLLEFVRWKSVTIANGTQ